MITNYQGQVGFALTLLPSPNMTQNFDRCLAETHPTSKALGKNEHLYHLVTDVKNRSSWFNSERRHCLLSSKTKSAIFQNLKPPTRTRSVSLAFLFEALPNPVLAAQPFENSLPIALNDFEIAFQWACQTWANTRMVDAKVMWSGLGPAPVEK